MLLKIAYITLIISVIIQLYLLYGVNRPLFYMDLVIKIPIIFGIYFILKDK